MMTMGDGQLGHRIIDHIQHTTRSPHAAAAAAGGGGRMTMRTPATLLRSSFRIRHNQINQSAMTSHESRRCNFASKNLVCCQNVVRTSTTASASETPRRRLVSPSLRSQLESAAACEVYSADWFSLTATWTRDSDIRPTLGRRLNVDDGVGQSH